MNGNLHRQYMGRRYFSRKLSFYSLCACGIGGTIIDTDHLISLVLNNPSLWAIFHRPLTVYVLLGGLGASILGLSAGYLLRRKL